MRCNAYVHLYIQERRYLTMKILQVTTTSKEVLRNQKNKKEQLPNGSSITKAIIMGGKSCCGASYVEKLA